MGHYKQRDEELFFLPILVLFSGFLSILFPFKTSLAPCFPSVPVPSVAIYVVKTEPRWSRSNEARLLFEVCENTSIALQPSFRPRQRKAWGAIIKDRLFRSTTIGQAFRTV